MNLTDRDIKLLLEIQDFGFAFANLTKLVNLRRKLSSPPPLRGPTSTADHPPPTIRGQVVSAYSGIDDGGDESLTEEVLKSSKNDGENKSENGNAKNLIDTSHLRDSQGVREVFENRMQREWLTTKEAAQFLGVSENALRIMVYRGQVSVYKFGRRLRFRFKDCEALFLKKGA